MFLIIYNLLSVFLLVPVCIYHLYRSVSRGRKASFGERFGFIAQDGLEKVRNRRVIWLHAVSVGEAIAARPLLKALRQGYPEHALVISCTTETGRGVAEKYAEKDLCIYFPFDFLPAASRALGSIRPELVIIMETEIWPNFMFLASRRGIPVLLANGRISDRSFGRYRKFSWFFRHSLALFSRLCMQSDADRERIVSIGAPRGTAETAGNLKYDIPCRPLDGAGKVEMRLRYGVPAEPLVIVAGSTHSGEEQFVIDAYSRLAAEFTEIFLVLVPRHPERAGEVEGMLRKSGLACRRRTAHLESSPVQEPGQVMLVDTVGELMNLYAMADLVFVGGSLVPTGGHNLLEPASVGAPVIFGPHMTNFREIAALVLEYDAGVQLIEPGALFGVCREMIVLSERRGELGQNGLKMVRESGGATEKHMAAIASCL